MLKEQQRHPTTKSQIQLQINISIGKKKYLLQVQKGAQLTQAVQNFLHSNTLNINYQGPILAMVRQQLAKKESVRVPEISDLQKIKRQVDDRKKSLLVTKASPSLSKGAQSRLTEGDMDQQYCQSSRINKENMRNSINSNSKQDRLMHTSKNKTPVTNDRRKQQIVSSPISLFPPTEKKQQQDPCKNLYEKWKVREKAKQTKGKSPKHQNIQEKSVQKKSISISKKKTDKKLQTHSPDYFYKRGVKFNEEKEANISQLYHKNYPFRLSTETNLTPRKKQQLHERLFKEQKKRQASLLKRQMQEKLTQIEKKPVMDKYKQKVKERDDCLNQALQTLVVNGMIKNPYKIQKTSKSPFRKTTTY